MEQVTLIDGLLRYLPLCETSHEYDSIIQEVTRLRRDVSAIEEMTRTERHRDIRMMEIAIESEINY